MRSAQQACRASTVGLRPDLVSLREQASGIESHDVDGKVLDQDGMADGLVFKAEAGGENQPARNCIAGGGKPLAQIEIRKGIGKLQPDGTERVQVGRGEVRKALREQKPAHGGHIAVGITDYLFEIEYSFAETQ